MLVRINLFICLLRDDIARFVEMGDRAGADEEKKKKERGPVGRMLFKVAYLLLDCNTLHVSCERQLSICLYYSILLVVFILAFVFFFFFEKTSISFQVGERLGIVEQTRLAPEFIAEIEKYYK